MTTAIDFSGLALSQLRASRARAEISGVKGAYFPSYKMNTHQQKPISPHHTPPTSYLDIPIFREKTQIHRQLLLLDLLLEHLQVTPDIARDLASLLKLGERNDSQVLLLDNVLEREQGSVQGPSQGRRNNELDLIMKREFFLQGAALVLTVLGEHWVRHYMVGRGQVVKALEYYQWLVNRQKIIFGIRTIN